MKVVLTNLGAVVVPAVSTEGDGFAVELHPNVPLSVDSEDISVLTVGVNPSMREDIIDALANIADLVRRLVTFWKQHAPKEAGQKPVVSLHIDNVHLTHGLRVRQGDDVNNDVEIAAGAQTDVVGIDYVELRELGLAGDTQPAESP